jgi:hypothetical protein
LMDDVKAIGDDRPEPEAGLCAVAGEIGETKPLPSDASIAFRDSEDGRLVG